MKQRMPPCLCWLIVQALLITPGAGCGSQSASVSTPTPQSTPQSTTKAPLQKTPTPGASAAMNSPAKGAGMAKSPFSAPVKTTAGTVPGPASAASAPASPGTSAFPPSAPVGSSAPAGSAAGLDWNSLTVAGDVTDRVRPFMRDGRLDLGTAKILGGKAVTLTRAELQGGKLVLTIQVGQPDRVVRFEGLDGMLGSYLPQGMQRRPVTIRGAAHDERFARRGVLQIGIPHPRPDRIQVAAVAQSSLVDEMRQEAERRKKVRKAEEANKTAGKKGPGAAGSANSATSPDGKAMAKKKGGGPGSGPASLIPGPETGYKPRSLEFTKLAVAVSALYRMPGRDTFRPDKRIRVEAARAAASYPNPKMQAYATKMLDRMQQDQAIDIDAMRAQLNATADQMSRQTLQYGSEKGSYVDSDGRQRTVLANGSEPDEEARAKASDLRALAAGTDEEIRQYVMQRRDQNTVFDLFFGNGISNRMDDLYQNILRDANVVLINDAKKAAGPISTACLIRIDRPDAATPVLTNVSDKTLTDVVVDLGWGFRRSTKLKTYGHGQFVFVPIWKPKEAVELQKIQLREPLVMHAKVNVYANEASSTDHVFALPDPGWPPRDEPGTIVIYEHRGFASIGKPKFAGVAWVEVDGKKVEWKSVEKPLEVAVEPGVHQVVVRAREKARNPRIVTDQQFPVDSGETRSVDVSFHE